MFTSLQWRVAESLACSAVNLETGVRIVSVLRCQPGDRCSDPRLAAPVGASLRLNSLHLVHTKPTYTYFSGNRRTSAMAWRITLYIKSNLQLPKSPRHGGPPPHPQCRPATGGKPRVANLLLLTNLLFLLKC